MSFGVPHRRMRDLVPEGAYREALRVRSYEAGQDGRTSPSTILRYLEQLATNASAAAGFDHRWYEDHGSAWVVREMTILLGTLPGIDEELELATWLSDFRRVQAYREYAVWYRRTGKRVARASGRWAYIDRLTGQLARVPNELVDAFPTSLVSLPPQRQRTLDATHVLARSEYAVTARRYEADSNQHINNCVYADWLAEALDGALDGASEASTGASEASTGASEASTGASEASAPPRRPRAYHIDYIRSTWPGDHMRIATRYQEQRGNPHVVA
jgi:acyl-ACP thioesterase